MKLRDRFLKTKSDAKIKRFGKTSCLFSECISIKVFFLKNLRLKSLRMSNADSLVCALYTLSHDSGSPQYGEAADVLRQVLVTLHEVLQQAVRQGVPHAHQLSPSACPAPPGQITLHSLMPPTLDWVTQAVSQCVSCQAHPATDICPRIPWPLTLIGRKI